MRGRVSKQGTENLESGNSRLFFLREREKDGLFLENSVILGSFLEAVMGIDKCLGGFGEKNVLLVS